MDLFELLFIAAFILFPVLEGILRKRKKGRGSGPSDGGPAAPGGSDADPEEVRTASDMVPDDLWELMTGERRQPGGSGGGVEGETPWSTGPDEVEVGGAATTVEERPDRDAEPWMDDSAVSPEPVSLEYEGPEAYSLETPAPEPLERRVPTAEARHRAFHELIDQPTLTGRRSRSPLVKALHGPDGLRRAVLFREILGPPKGLE